MTALGHQIARLLQPEHWEEWARLATCVHHLRLNLTISNKGPLFMLHGIPSVDLAGRLPWLERRHIQRLAEKMIRGLTERAEERAIEELLRS